MRTSATRPIATARVKWAYKTETTSSYTNHIPICVTLTALYIGTNSSPQKYHSQNNDTVIYTEVDAPLNFGCYAHAAAPTAMSTRTGRRYAGVFWELTPLHCRFLSCASVAGVQFAHNFCLPHSNFLHYEINFKTVALSLVIKLGSGADCCADL